MNSDPQWLSSFEGIANSMPDPSAGLTDIFELIATDPRRWSQFVNGSKLAFASHVCPTALVDAWTR